ncbi:hypothetical protein OLX02_00195 [Novosphingobium sp. KCTC 2891]|uniref:hypothetical protein n=1 Tax=Novosphingobium sp. KCTC 2891 TaxID=2989730 RepID=UPI00222290B4|nr:hypothetical protein [Novosphingobium sp. KCTC 2891]MCW1381231.1 hypothetical protein [Novosphingobium sp. KCTC 2891]
MIATPRRLAVIGASLLAVALSGCSKNKGELVVDDSVGVTALRSPCPVVAIPEMTGDVTLFSVPGRTDSAAIDVTAAITNLRSTCNDAAGEPKLYTEATFDVLARRADTRGARHVDLPYFSTVVRGGNAVISKRIGTIGIDFADGQERASAQGRAGSYVDRTEATLPKPIRDRLSKKRRAGDPDAAVDPLAQPDVKAALARASFELLVGFQLTNDQLAYNATR